MQDSRAQAGNRIHTSPIRRAANRFHALTVRFAPLLCAPLLFAPLLFTSSAARALPQALPASDTLLLSLAAQGGVALAVGEHGTILRSIDGGATWEKVAAPTTANLTRVILPAAGAAYAVGFDATILRSTDRGAHWTKVFSDDHADNPLFGIAADPSGAALAAGAFGRAYRAADGITWHSTEIAGAGGDLHDNALLAIGPSRWLLAGESAQLLLTDDAGGHWRKLDLPGAGSLFGAVALTQDHWLVFGLRGHIYATLDAGAHWRDLDAGTKAELLGGTALRDGRALLVGNRGTQVLVSADLRVARTLVGTDRTNYADCLQRPDGSVVAVGDAGLAILPIPGVAQ